METVISSTIQRVFWVCQACKYRETIDYRADTMESVSQVGTKVQRVILWREVDGRQVRAFASYKIPGDSLRYCPSCGRRNWETRFLRRITVKSDRPCNASCEGATSETCECSCGGKNHGIAHRHGGKE